MLPKESCEGSFNQILDYLVKSFNLYERLVINFEQNSVTRDIFYLRRRKEKYPTIDGSNAAGEVLSFQYDSASFTADKDWLTEADEDDFDNSHCW